MINRIIELSVYNRGLVFLLTLAAMIAGWFSFRSLPIDAVPDITTVQVQINTPVQGLAPEEVERFVTYPIESLMGGVPGVEEVRSITRFGLSQVTIVFSEGTNIYLARQLVSERLQSVKDELPANVTPVLGPITTGLGEVLFYALEAKEPAIGDARLEQLMELRSINDWFVKPRLLTVKGVAEVNAIGGYEKQYYVLPNLEAMSQYGVHIDDIVQALKENNRNTGGGYIQQTAEQLLVQAVGIVRNLDDIKQIPVKKLTNFRTITIGDIADVGLERELRTGAALLEGNETVLGTVLMLLGENSREVSERVREKIGEIEAGLPDDVRVDVIYTRSDLVDETLGTVEENLLHGALLVTLILLLLVGNFRVAIITAITIPLALVGTFIFMRIFNVSGNLMSLGALDFGIIVDGAVIVMDNCARIINKRANAKGGALTRDEIKRGVVDATIEIRKAAGFGQVIIIMVFLPLFALTGVEGKMFVPMAATFCFALISGFIFSFSTIPALAGTFLSGKPKDKEPILMRLFQTAYFPLLNGSLRIKPLVVMLGAVSILLGGFLYNRLGSEFLPQLDEGSIAIQFVRPTDISIDQAVEMQKVSEKVIKEFSQVKTVFSRMGTSEIATDPMGVNLADTYILLNPREGWEPLLGKETPTKDDLVQALKERLESLIPGQSIVISQPIQLRFNELLEGVRADVALKIFGEDLDKLSDLSAEAAEIIESIDGAGDVEAEVKGKSPILRITPNSIVLNKFGVSKEEVLETVEVAIGGEEAGSLFQGVQRFPIIVRLRDEDRSSIEAISRVPVGISEGFTIPLKDVTKIGVEETFGEIKRESSKKRAAVLINIRGRDTESFVEEAQQKIREKIKLPPGFYIEWGGSFKNLESAKERLMVLVPIALLMVILMIYTAFKSVLQTILIFLCVPLALVGGVLGLMLNDLPFSISAGVGFIALSGIAVLNGVVLVSYFNQLKQEGLSGDELIKEGTKIRLRPVLMTALADALGFLPMMLSTGMGAEVQKPLASVVVGGIISATILTLFVLPILYRLLESRMTVFESGGGH